MYTLYILRCADDTLYTGIAKNLEKRLAMHRSGTGAKYVRGRLPFELVYTEVYKDRSSAMKREIEVKKWSKQKKEKLIKEVPSLS
ncbi:MAG: endonuclease [Candidatus Magasanikbacteria bacterium CG11_big_fil_rev_8_21_14_0_20_43_7]|uniref:Endonuclease n=1 Tax=Candidatus Magasanikbacteria bacterium CG11_big_fil_rev_8_21_14_0_20_43_7 TaxID=1974654 RepID=A0A2H0N1X3_9BACT|nr:MAG: endonuclease [Candidatus Magasanikbacteria bacterium CG11_big_fil_rev_8_21_14_0_20_43_7]